MKRRTFLTIAATAPIAAKAPADMSVQPEVAVFVEGLRLPSDIAHKMDQLARHRVCIASAGDGSGLTRAELAVQDALGFLWTLDELRRDDVLLEQHWRLPDF